MICSGRFGQYGGFYVPETLMPALEELEEAFYKFQKNQENMALYRDILAN